MLSYITEGIGPRLLVANITALLITWSFASVRIYVRLFLVKSWRVEDWFFIAAQVTFSILNVISFLSMCHGNGQKLALVHPGDLVIAMRYWYLTELCYSTSTFLLRVSIGFLLLRICTERRYQYLVWATLVCMSIVYTFFFFFCVFQCRPVSYFWLQFAGEAGSCVPSEAIRAVSVAHSAVSAAADMIFGFLPIYLIWNLQMNIKTKISISILLSLGIFAGATVIVRIEFSERINPNGEWLYAAANLALWSMIEPTIGIACTAAATFRPLFKSLRERTRYGSTRAASTADATLRSPSMASHGNGNGNGAPNGRAGVGPDSRMSMPGASGSRGSNDGFGVALPSGVSLADGEALKDVSMESLSTRTAGGDGEGGSEHRMREGDAGPGVVRYERTISNSSQQKITEMV